MTVNHLVPGSSPGGGAIVFGGVAQLGERLLCKQDVAGSIPVTSTKSPLHTVYNRISSV